MAVRRGQGTCVKRKDGRYMASLSMGLDEDGKPLRPCAYGKTAAEAQAGLDLKVAAIRKGEYKRRSPLTLEKFISNLLTAQRDSGNLRVSTLGLYEGLARKHIAPTLGNRRLDGIKARDIEGLYRKLQSDGVSERVVQHVHAFLSMVFGTAARTEKIVVNPMTRLQSVPKYKAPEQIALTTEEGEALLRVAKAEPLAALYFLALDSGARQGELLALKRADVDLKNRTISIRRSIRYTKGKTFVVTGTKTGRDRLVPISTRTANVLKAHMKANMADEFIFTSKSGLSLRRAEVGKDLRRLLAQAELSRHRFSGQFVMLRSAATTRRFPG